MAWCKAGIGWLAALLLWPAIAAAQQPTIQSTSVRLELTRGYVGPETLSQLERALNETVSTALLEQLGGDLDYVLNHQDEVAATLGSVVEPVLSKRGFSMEQLVVEPGPKTEVLVKLHLTQELATNFSVRFYILGNTPVINDLIAADEETVASTLFSTVANTPYGDARWFSGLVTDAVERGLAGLSGYSEFDHFILVEPGAKTKVAVTLTPRSGVAVVTNYTLHQTSLSLMSAMLVGVRDRAAHHLQSLIGAPLDFVQGRLGQLQTAMFQDLVNCSELADLSATACLDLELKDCLLAANLTVDSERYLLGLGARLDLWDHSDDRDYLARLTGRVGFMPAPGLAVYASAHYFPAAGEVFPMLGVGKLWAGDTFVGAGWDFNADGPRLQATHNLSPVVYLSADVFTHKAQRRLSEFAVHYRIRDIYELQLISNLDGDVFAAAAANF